MGLVIPVAAPEADKAVFAAITALDALLTVAGEDAAALALTAAFIAVEALSAADDNVAILSLSVKVFKVYRKVLNLGAGRYHPTYRTLCGSRNHCGDLCGVDAAPYDCGGCGGCAAHHPFQ